MNKKRSIVAAIMGLERLTTLLIQRELEKYGLGRGQFYFLNQLLFNGDGISHKELSWLCSVDKAATTRGVQKLQDLGYVQVEEDPKDARSRRIYVTEKARAMEKEYHEIFREVNRKLMENFTLEETEALREGLYRMWDTLREVPLDFSERKSVVFQPVGYYYRDLTSLEGDAEEYVRIEGPYRPGLEDLKEGDILSLIFHFHRGKTALKVKRRGTGPMTGVFATRSPNRPNGIGITDVKVLRIVPEGLWVEGGDMFTGTPILDIKPGNQGVKK